MKLFDFQKPLVEDALSLFEQGNETLLFCAAAGAGKTTCATVIAETMLASGAATKILVIAHGRNELRTNFGDTLERCFKKGDWAYVGRPNWKKARVNVLIYQSGAKLTKEQCEGYDLVIVDEAHQFLPLDVIGGVEDLVDDEGKESKKLARDLFKKCRPGVRKLLLTATPAKFIDMVNAQKLPIVCFSGKELADAGRAAPVKVILSTTAGDLSTDEDLDTTLGELLNEVTLRHFLPPHSPGWLNLKAKADNFVRLQDRQWKKTLFACGSTKIANRVHQYFSDLGVENVFLSHTGDKEGYGDGYDVSPDDFKECDGDAVLVTVNRAQLGFDDPQITTVVDLRHTSESLCEQTIKRGIDSTHQLEKRLRLYVDKNGVADPTVQKTFIKVVHETRVDDARLMLYGALCLNHKDVVSKYWNGKSFAGMTMPMAPRQPKQGGPAPEGSEHGPGEENGPRPPSSFLKVLEFDLYDFVFKGGKVGIDDAYAENRYVYIEDVYNARRKDDLGTLADVYIFISVFGRVPSAQAENAEEAKLGAKKNDLISRENQDSDIAALLKARVKLGQQNRKAANDNGTKAAA
ncbi:MAG: DEAD/DEAH box helicase family protein [Blastocatellia bacterium]|nr:DEAD/DEAH box helicase family protein [Blastocatellia bacterium]